MRCILYVAALAALSEAVQAFCPSQRMEYDTIKRAVQHESARAKRLVPRSTIDVNIYLHNVARGSTWNEGYVSETLLKEQFNIIHDRFLPYGIKMSLGGLDHTINALWANNTVFSQSEADMKNALHRGTYTDINIYVVDRLFYPDRINDTETHIDLGNDLGIQLYEVRGFTHFPVSGITFYSDYITDAVMLSHTAVWGSNVTGKDLGLTVVHEIGHWFGLEHTFLHGCVGLGDGIADTPVEDIANVTDWGCKVQRDTCPDQPGLDPIYNYMDYTDDACKTEFTPGQVERMHTIFEILRKPKVP